eukprot:TRINITY_DN11768_c0_g1_i1.p2 TRINITY_DN11768_c0_g1~~TRINITY_DN11768_c0_g1_i1.p2  ORF type:complete len:135 (-),score=37.57 TRINITY_DN11768_c0_g1_i1:85-489(-)
MGDSDFRNADIERREGLEKLKAEDFAGARAHFLAAQRLVDNVDPEKEGQFASEIFGFEEGKEQRTAALARDMADLEKQEALKAAPKRQADQVDAENGLAEKAGPEEGKRQRTKDLAQDTENSATNDAPETAPKD